MNNANGSKMPNLVFLWPSLLEKKNDASDKHNQSPDFRSCFHEDWDLSGFYSHRLLDGVITDGAITSIYKTGLHRSQKEADKKNLFTMKIVFGIAC